MGVVSTRFGRARLLSRDELAEHPEWPGAFAAQCKDHRFYEVTDGLLAGGFEFRYLALEDHDGRTRAIQPLFFVDQDLMVATKLHRPLAAIRKLWPRFLILRTLMVGCAAGEGHIEDPQWTAGALHEALEAFRGEASLIVLKDFPAAYRAALTPFSSNGYARIPSMPMTSLALDFGSFEEYMAQRLGRVTRKSLRRKLKRAGDLPMEVRTDIAAIVDEIYPLYIQVHERSSLRFERLTPEFLCSLGERMPDRVRFFIWRSAGRAVAFSLCFVHGDSIYDDYLGLDYTVALERHLYFRTFRDIIEWALAQGLKTYHSSPLNYDPKLHLRCRLEPLDLYVSHSARPLNWLFKRAVRLVQPTRHDPVLARFPNAHEL
jgi:hypothetical protein